MARSKVIIDIELNSSESQKRAAQLTADIQKNTTARRELRKELRELQKDEKANANAIALVSEELNRLDRNTKESRTELNVLNRELSAGTNSLDQNRAALKRLEFEYGKFRVGIDGTEKELKDLEKQTKALSDAVKAQEESIGDSRRSVGDYGKALRDTFTPEGLGSITDLADNFKGLGAALLTPVGALTALGVGLGTAGAKFVDFSRDLANARLEVEQITGATGDAAGLLASQARTLEQQFGADTIDTLTAINTVTKELGGSASQNLDNLGKLASLTGERFVEALDVVGEYPAQFQGLGVSADEFFAIANQQFQEGIFSDKGVDAIKEGLLSLRELTPATRAALEGIGISSAELQERLASGTTTAFEELQNVSTRLDEFPEQSAEVGTAIADIFRGAGEDAGIRYLKTIDEINLSLDDQLALASDQIKQQEELRKANDQINLTYDQLFAASGQFFNEALTGAKSLFANGLVSLVRGTESLVNGFIDLYNNAIVVRGFFNSFFAQVKTGIDIVVGGFQIFINSLSTIGDAIGALLRGDFSSIGDIISEGFSNATNIVSETATSIGNNFSEAFEETVNGRLEKVEFLRDIEESANEAGGNTGNNFGQGLEDTLGGRIQNLQSRIALLNKTKLELNVGDTEGIKRIESEIEKAQAALDKLNGKAPSGSRGSGGSSSNNRQEEAKQEEDTTLRAQKARIEAQIAQEEAGSQELINLRIQLAETERDIALKNEKLLEEEKELIRVNSLNKILDLQKESTDLINEEIIRGIDEEIALNENKLIAREISEEEFIKSNTDLQEKRIQAELRTLEEGSEEFLKKERELIALRAEEKEDLQTLSLNTIEEGFFKEETALIASFDRRKQSEEQFNLDILKLRRDRLQKELELFDEGSQERLKRERDIAKLNQEIDEKEREDRRNSIEETRASVGELGEFLSNFAEQRAQERIAQIEGNETLSDSAKEQAIAEIEAEKEKSLAFQAGRVLRKAAALADVTISTQQQLSQIGLAATNIAAAIPAPVGPVLGTIYRVTQTALTLGRAAQQIAQIRALEEGGSTSSAGSTLISISPDGSVSHEGFAVSSDPSLLKRGGEVTKPTLSILPSGEPAILGEKNRSEYVVPHNLLKIPRVAQVVGEIESMRVRGFELGGFTKSFRVPAFEDGGFSNSQLQNQTFGNDFTESLKEAVREINPIVTVEDINTAQRNRAIVENSGNI